MTNPRFLALYRKLLKPAGWLKFKTDNTELFEYTLETLQQEGGIQHLSYTFDLYKSNLWQEHFGIKTRYERMFTEKGEKIKYLKFQFQ
jgi:tRNA (guanine-N7-)-methyltransferase